MQKSTHPFKPLIFKDSKTLVLGSFPSLKSFENSFYYAHPRNQFWPILSRIYSMPADSRDERIELLKDAKLALWDVVGSCERTNSADSNLKSCEPNDIEALLREYGNIEKILFTGRKAEALFKRYFKDKIKLPTALLPSPSPAYAAIDFETKVKIWREVFGVV